MNRREAKFVAYFDGNRVSFRLVDSICSIRVKRSPDGAMDNTLFPKESRALVNANRISSYIDSYPLNGTDIKGKIFFSLFSIDARYRD